MWWVRAPRNPHLSPHATSQMEKDGETTRELLLPDWQGSGSHGLTIMQRDDGVFVQEVKQDSPAARAGVVQEGESWVWALECQETCGPPSCSSSPHCGWGSTLALQHQAHYLACLGLSFLGCTRVL